MSISGLGVFFSLLGVVFAFGWLEVYWNKSKLAHLLPYACAVAALAFGGAYDSNFAASAERTVIVFIPFAMVHVVLWWAAKSADRDSR